MKKTALVLMLFTILTKISGFLREIVLAYFYGASNISDAYLISMTIPGAIFEFVGVGIATSFIPIYSSIKETLDTRNKFINNVLNLLIAICSLITVIILVFAPQLVKIFASGFTGDTFTLAVLFTRIIAATMYFTGILHVLKSFLQINDNFSAPAVVGTLFNFTIVLCIILSFKFNLIILAIGTVLAKMLEVLFVIPFCYKKKYRYRIFLDFRDENLRKMMYLALPVIVGVSINQINVLVDKTLASSIAIGGISALNYANNLNLFIQGLFVITLSTAMYPLISKMAAESNINGLKDSVAEAIKIISLLVIPATVGAMIFAKPIIVLLFGRGAFDLEAIEMTANALFFYSIGMIAFGFREILSRAFYSLQDTKTPTINAAISMVMNIVLNIIFSRIMGIGGLALATSISATTCTILLFISLRKKIGEFGLKGIMISISKLTLSSLIMGVITRVVYSVSIKYIGANLALVGSIGVGAVIYFIIIYFLRIEEVDTVVNIVKKKLRVSREKEK